MRSFKDCRVPGINAVRSCISGKNTICPDNSAGSDFRHTRKNLASGSQPTVGLYFEWRIIPRSISGIVVDIVRYSEDGHVPIDNYMIGDNDLVSQIQIGRFDDRILTDRQIRIRPQSQLPCQNAVPADPSPPHPSATANDFMPQINGYARQQAEQVFCPAPLENPIPVCRRNLKSIFIDHSSTRSMILLQACPSP